MLAIQYIILILGGWTVVLGGVFYFFSGRIADWLNAKWKERVDSRVVKLQGKHASLSDILSLSGANFHQAQERRIKAIEVLWQNLLKWKKVVPTTGEFVFNELSDQEIRDYFTMQLGNQFSQHLRDSLLLINVDKHWEEYLELNDIIDKEIPFIGQRIWDSFIVYRFFIVHIAVLTLNAARKRQFEHWHNDNVLQDLFKKSLSKEEYSYIYSLKHSSYKITCELLETKLIKEIDKTLSGETLAESSLERMKKFEKLIAQGRDWL